MKEINRPLRPPRCRTLIEAAVLAATFAAVPSPAGAAPPAALPAAPAPTTSDLPTSDELADVQTAMDPTDKLRELDARIEQTRSLVLGHQPRVTVGGYADLGFFVPQGDGTGFYRDDAHVLFPQYGNYGWVFLGDILSTAVNSRGEVANLGSATGAGERFDSIHSGGAPGFIANEVNLTLTSGLGETAVATASVNFVPRSGSNFDLGDFLDVDLAQLEWMPTRSQRTSIFVGKFDSVLGIEYRERKAAQRFGITPSLIARYTTGTALGIKARSKLGPDDLFIIAGSATNGSFTTEQFHFYNEIDTNLGKTLSGRAALHPPLPLDVELGVSGSWGAQDRSPNSDGKMWFWGVDLQAHTQSVDFKAQFLKGSAPGDPRNRVYGLNLHGGAYAEVDWMLTPLFGLLGRAEYRDAIVWLGDEHTGTVDDPNRLYLTKSWRGTGGLRFVFSDRIILKAEYLKNGEYGGIPQIKNDVITTSLLLIN
jgi:hypothetical protein